MRDSCSARPYGHVETRTTTTYYKAFNRVGSHRNAIPGTLEALGKESGQKPRVRQMLSLLNKCLGLLGQSTHLRMAPLASSPPPHLPPPTPPGGDGGGGVAGGGGGGVRPTLGAPREVTLSGRSSGLSTLQTRIHSRTVVVTRNTDTPRDGTYILRLSNKAGAPLERRL
jgi:hypothetical protein